MSENQAELTIKLDNSSLIILLTEIRDEIRKLQTTMLSFVSSVNDTTKISEDNVSNANAEAEDNDETVFDEKTIELMKK